MFRNKVDVDRHVAKTLAKLKTEKDRNFRAYSIARLYFDVGDYESCCTYVGWYLGVKDNNPAAHTLLGQAYQKLGQTERALAEYKASLDLDPNQNNLILRVCELLGSDSISIDAGRARFWVERAEVVFPNHRSVYLLKERLLAARGADPVAHAALLRQEVAARPHEPLPHVRLLRHLITTNTTDSFKHAFKHALYTQFKVDSFRDNLVWYETVIEVLSKYQLEKTSLGWDFWVLRLTTLEKAAELSMAEGRGLAEAGAALWRLDQDLFEAAKHVSNVAPSRALAAELLKHFGAQLCLHAATLLLKRAAREQGGWREAVRVSAPLLLLALQATPIEIQELPTSPANVLNSWSLSAAYRRSQAGHTLLSCVKERKQIFLDKVTQYCSGPHWRDKLYKKLFTNREHVAKINSSYLQTSETFAEPEMRLPRNSDLQQEDMVAQRSRPECLHRQVWLGMNSESLDQVSCVSVGGLPASINNLPNCGAETLNRFDLDAFLYCTIITTRQNIENSRKAGYYDPDRPHVLPAIMTDQLSSHNQAKWWECAYRVTPGSGVDLSDIRLTLTRGIETVRCIGNHGLDPKLLSELARTFKRRAENCADPSQKRFLEARAALYYTVGVPLLERIRNNISIRPPDKRLFDYTHGNLPSNELDSLIEEGKLFLAVQYMTENNDEKAIEILETIKSPYASFHLYKIYRKLANDQVINDKENVTSEMRSKNIILLTKARDFIYLTMDRLKASHADSDHPLFAELGDHIESIETSLSKIEPDMNTNKKHSEGKYYSDESSQGSGGDRPNRTTTYIHNTTPLRRARMDTSHRSEPQPSPECLEAQIRQLQRKNSIMGAFIEQTKVLVESNRTLVEEVRDMKKSLGEIRSHSIEDTVDRFESLKLSVDEVKTKINDYRQESTANVADLKREISELKKELCKIKSTPVEQQQLDDTELFMLEEEAASGGLPYFQRAAANTVLPPQPYPAYPPGALYPLYGQYPGVPQLFPPHLFTPDQSMYPPELLAPVRALQAAEKLPAHNYQIPLPALPPMVSLGPVLTSTPVKPVLDVPQPLLPPPVVAASKPFSLFDSPKVSTTSEVPKPFSFLGTPGLLDVSQPRNTTLDKSRTLSEKSTDSYDPIPDFKPIIELPDEIQIKTGEEDEEVLFDNRAKLFRFIAKEWKERGLGQIKLLKNKKTGKVRVLMRRERVHNICANHIITPEIEISPMKDRDKAYFWVANDFADEVLTVEKFCIRFKTVDVGKKFYDIFCKAREDSKLIRSDTVKEVLPTSATVEGPKPTVTISKASIAAVGGLTFSETPTIKSVSESPAVVTTSADVVKPNPFAGFVFSKPATTTSSPVFNIFSAPKPAVVKFANAPFSATIPGSGDEGQRDESLLFESKGELLMLDMSSKNMKKKGIGNMQVLVNTNDNKKVRLFMRQEVNGLVCCDHLITEKMLVEKLPGQENTLTWAITVPASLTFVIKFPNSEVCQGFRETITEAQDNMADVKSVSGSNSKFGFGDMFKPKEGSWTCESCYTSNNATTQTCVACSCPKEKTSAKVSESTPVIPAPVSGWGDKFKPKQGSWDCKLCYINNDATMDYCIACDSPKDPSMPKKEAKNLLTEKVEQKFTFGIPANGTTKTTAAVSNSVPSFAALAQNATKPTNFTFGIPKPAETSKIPVVSPAVTSSSVLSNLSAKITSSPVTASHSDSAIKSALGSVSFPQENNKFQFTFKPKSPTKLKSPEKKNHDSDDYASEDEGEHLVFAPVVPLPDKVEVKTGEEEEEVLYCHLAKLFRFANGEWKECGLGKIKLLKNPTTNKLRMLMRRDQVLKICLNHALTRDIKYLVKDDKTWLFTAPDYSSGEITPQQFCIRFKTKDIATDFMDAINKALEQSTDAPEPSLASVSTVVASSDDEVQFVTETKVSDEEVNQARSFLLPDNFYAYKQKEDCKGCIGCHDEDFVYDGTPAASSALKHVESDTKLAVESAPKPAEKTPSTSAPTAFIFGQPLKTTVTSTASLTSQFSTQKPIFGTSTTSIFGTTTNSLSFFGAKPPAESKPSLLAAPKLSTAVPEPTTEVTKSGSFFGGQPLFSSKPATTFGNSENIFKVDEKAEPPKTNYIWNSSAPAFGSTENKPFFGSTFATAPVKTDTSVSAPGAPVLTQAPSIFSGTGETNSSVFGGTTNLFGNSAVTGSSIFGSKPIGQFGIPDAKTTANFGELNSKPLTFGVVPEKSTSVFGGANSDAPKSVFGNGTSDSAVKQDPEKPSFLSVNLNDLSSFSALAANTSAPPKTEIDKPATFTWAGAGTPLFGGKSAAPKGDGEADGNEEYDPHYEPIIAMPDEITVVTGEEDEAAEFNEMAKLYRFTDGEWRERGTGELRILHHPQRRTHRLLLRQLQVHKLVLNQLITADLQLLPMPKTERAYMWAGLNYTDDAQGLAERLAVRFSNANVAHKFKTQMDAIMLELQSRGPKDQLEPVTTEEVSPEEEEHDDHEDQDDQDGQDAYEFEDFDEDNYYVEEEVVYDCEAEVEGEVVQVLLMSEGRGGRLRVLLKEQFYSDLYITSSSTMEHDGQTCSWKDDNDAELKAVLATKDDAARLYASFYDLLSSIICEAEPHD